jgi:hypothetical protein
MARLILPASILLSRQNFNFYPDLIFFCPLEAFWLLSLRPGAQGAHSARAMNRLGKITL